MLGKRLAWISVSAVAVAMVAGGTPVGLATEPASYTDIDVDDLLLEEGTSWTLVDDGPPLALRAVGRPGLAADPVSLRVEGIDTLGFVATVKGGALEVLVDGEVVATLGRGTSTRDIPLDPGAHVVTWRHVPALVDDRVELVLHGARSLLPPSLLWATKQMWSWCGSPPVMSIHFVFSALVARGDITVTYNGEAMDVSAWTYVHGLERHHFLHVEVPEAPDGTPGVVNATFTDVTGRVWPLVTDLTTKVRTATPISLWPSGWVYDLRPTVHAFTPCGYDRPVKLQLFVDGVDRTSEDAQGVYSTYTFDHDLPFGETHTAEVVVEFENGTVVTKEVEFREGLDVLEFDLDRLALVFGETYVATPTMGFGEGVFANALGPHELPPIQDELRGPLAHDPSQPWHWPDGAHLRVVFAPLGLHCGEIARDRISIAATCSPYDGGAPGFTDREVLAAELIVTAPDGTVTTIPAAGQWAAASRFTLEPDRRLPAFVKDAVPSG